MIYKRRRNIRIEIGTPSFDSETIFLSVDQRPHNKMMLTGHTDGVVISRTAWDLHLDHKRIVGPGHHFIPGQVKCAATGTDVEKNRGSIIRFSYLIKISAQIAGKKFEHIAVRRSFRIETTVEKGIRIQG